MVQAVTVSATGITHTDEFLVEESVLENLNKKREEKEVSLGTGFKFYIKIENKYRLEIRVEAKITIRDNCLTMGPPETDACVRLWLLKTEMRNPIIKRLIRLLRDCDETYIPTGFKIKDVLKVKMDPLICDVDVELNVSFDPVKKGGVAYEKSVKCSTSAPRKQSLKKMREPLTVFLKSLYGMQHTAYVEVTAADAVDGPSDQTESEGSESSYTLAIDSGDILDDLSGHSESKEKDSMAMLHLLKRCIFEVSFNTKAGNNEFIEGDSDSSYHLNTLFGSNSGERSGYSETSV
ncbi:hypothetical protein ECANGB1_1918 [Enterospora canceri]|uniref:Uncharacterized protein n=1 Tax=Enterospora canceri TaxID=1081671 RepID=A0A1Y1S8X8_9MICR|nr:hypothetical protein ECANGB1_1918 [Enterospora canceri]